MEELRWVHGMVRRDLRTCRDLAAAVLAGAGAGAVRDSLAALQTGGPLWQLRAGCLRYCYFVHHHHRAEDVMLFAGLRRADPALGPTLDRLQADHREVSGLLDRIEQAAGRLGGDGEGDARPDLLAALEELSGTLLAHLDVEERALEPILQRLDDWPF